MTLRMTLNEYCTVCNVIAHDHGWWDVSRSPLEIAALIMTELAEFVEGARAGDKKNMEEELADVFIRLADYCGQLGLDLDGVVQKKMEINRKRPHRHGGKLF